MIVYYAQLLDHTGKVIDRTRKFASNNQAAAVAGNLIRTSHPAQGFKVVPKHVSASDVARMINALEEKPIMETAV